MSSLLACVKRMGVLAVVLVALLFALGGRAEAAEHGSDHPAAHAEHAQHQQTAAAHAEHDGNGLHHGEDCHCVSAACASVLPALAPSHEVRLPRSRHGVPAGSPALKLAGQDPPAKPPRA